MTWGLVDWGQFITLFMIAVALGMDAFSLGIGIGMAGVRLRTVLRISLTIGLFHVIMPLIGMAAGIYLTSIIGDVATFFGGAVLSMLGIHMLWNGFFGKENNELLVRTSGLSLILFSMSVSLDALSVGFSFGLFAVDAFLAVILFGIIGTIMAGSGLMLGRTVGGWLGHYGEILGGIILLLFGIKFLA
ncbi:MAG: manganese efflux pump [Bacillaceae bacterium]|nr:manganese efflux pump [Bacillaceae bacterium]